MACSCSATDVSRNYVDTTVPQLIADLCACLLIEVLVELVATTSFDWRKLVCNLLIPFACVGRTQFVESLEVVRVKDVSYSGNRGQTTIIENML